MSTPDPIEILAAMRLDNGQRWGEVAADWQLADARAVLTPGPDDPLAHWLGRPKGASKSTDIAGIGMAWLLSQARPLAESYVFASDLDQAGRLLKRAAGLVSRTPGLSAQLEVQTHRVVHRQTGASLIALAEDPAGAEGIISPLVLVEELPQWKDSKVSRDMWAAALSSMTKIPRADGGVRFVVIGHAGIAGSWQHAEYLDCMESPTWRVVDVPGPLPWVDADVLEDQRRKLVASQFARRHLNQWGAGEDRLTTVDELARCVVLDGPLVPRPGVDYVTAVDLGLVNDATVAAVAHLEPMGSPVGGASPARSGRWGTGEEPRVESVRVVLDRMQVWQGSKSERVQISEVEDWILQASRSFNSAPAVVDPWQMVGSVQRLRQAGVVVEEFTFSAVSVGRLASTLHSLLKNTALSIPDDPELLDELVNVKLIEKSPGVVRMDHASGRHDDRATALGLAAWYLLNRPPKPKGFAQEYRGTALQGTR